MVHKFNTDVAKAVGLHSAVVAFYLDFWIEKNMRDGHNFINGRYWTYNTIKEYSSFFTYLTDKQIRFAIDNLVNNGYLVKGDFSRNRFVRPNWYSFEQKYYDIVGNPKNYKCNKISKANLILPNKNGGYVGNVDDSFNRLLEVCANNNIEQSLKNLPYKKFLKTLYWRIISAKVRQDNNSVCEKCGSPIKLNIHHTTYNIHGQEHLNLDKLQCLCEICHTNEHNK